MRNNNYLHKAFGCRCADHVETSSFSCEGTEEGDVDLAILQKMRTLADNAVCIDADSSIFTAKPVEP